MNNCVHVLLCFGDRYQEVKLVAHMAALSLLFLKKKNSILFSKGVELRNFPTSFKNVSPPLTISLQTQIV